MAGLFAALSYRQSRAEDPGLTGEITLVLTTLLGGLSLTLPALAGGLGVVVAALVYLKAPLHQLARERVSGAMTMRFFNSIVPSFAGSNKVVSLMISLSVF